MKSKIRTRPTEPVDLQQEFTIYTLNYYMYCCSGEPSCPADSFACTVDSRPGCARRCDGRQECDNGEDELECMGKYKSYRYNVIYCAILYVCVQCHYFNKTF